jgi:hypothetical protein
MVGIGYQWVVRVWSLGGVGLVAGWSLGSLVVVVSLGGVGPVVGSSLGSLVGVGSSFGAIHHWAVLLSIGYGRCGGWAVVVVVPVVVVVILVVLLWLSSPLW